MTVVGIIAEYNPFHNGHLHHILEIKKKLNPDHIVCVMSGNYTQRGEPACMHKRERVDTALKAGIDCVIELPFVFATASAAYFAHAGVSILHRLNRVTHISFGCEDPNLELMTKIAKVLAEEPCDYRKTLMFHLQQGLGFAKARHNALLSYFQNHRAIESMLTGSNNILALEYIKALIQEKSHIKAFPIRRMGPSYNDTDVKGQLASATAIRKMLCESSCVNPTLEQTVPHFTWERLLDQKKTGCLVTRSKALDLHMRMLLHTTSSQKLSTYPSMEPGLALRCKKMLDQAYDIPSFIDAVCCKRYPRTRIRRLLMHMTAGLSEHEFTQFTDKAPTYARILGFRNCAQPLIASLSKGSEIPLCIKTSDIRALTVKEPIAKRCFDYEVRTTNLYQMLMPAYTPTWANSEYRYALLKR